ncbi:MAG: lipopolysaccharide kinase InaA family protein [Thermodesulfobacteriota bacterium]
MIADNDAVESEEYLGRLCFNYLEKVCIVSLATNSKVICLSRELELGEDPDSWLARVKAAGREPLKVVKGDSAKLTLKTILEPWGQVCLQEMKWNGLKKKLSFFRRPPGRVTWDTTLILTELDIPVVEQLLYLEFRRKGFVSRTYQISRWQDGYNLGEIAGKRPRVTEEKLITILEKAIRLIARLHGAGFIHGDLKWTNFLYIPDHGREVILTDLDHVRRSNSAVSMGKDLGRFILSASEYNMGKRVEKKLITNYLEAFKGPAAKVERSLYKRMARKREKYEKRRLDLQI